MAVNHTGVFPWPLTKRCMLSGMTAVICTYPLDVVRARLAFQVTGDHRYTGIINAFQTIYLKVMHVFSGTLPSHAAHADCFFKLKEDPPGFSFFFLPLKEGGVRGFYRGLTPTLIGMAPYAGEYRHIPSLDCDHRLYVVGPRLAQ